MSIASEITRLSGVRSDIFTSITNKGVAVPAGSTFSSCPTLIDSIVTGGGGGDPTSLINPSFTASGLWSAYRPFTATQNIQTISAFEERDEVWTNPVTSQAGNRILIPVYSADIKNFYESNSVDILGTTLNFDYTATNPVGDMSMYVYMVPQAQYSQETSNTVTSTNVGVWNPPGTYEIPLQMSKIYSILASNSAQWQWTVQNGIVYIGLQDQWYAVGNKVTAMNVSSLYKVVTGTTTAYPYPNYDPTTTGFVQNTVELDEMWDSGKAKLSAFTTYTVNYDSSPSITATQTPSTAYVNTFSSNMLKNWGNTKINNNGNDSNYTYSYGATETAYSGFEGV